MADGKTTPEMRRLLAEVHVKEGQADMLYAQSHQILKKRKLANNSRKAALVHFNEAIITDGLYTEAYIGRGVVKELLGDKKGKVADHQYARELMVQQQPENAKQYMNRAELRFRIGDQEDAFADSNKASELTDTAEGLYEIAMMRKKYGDFEGAIAELDKAKVKGTEVKYWIEVSELRRKKGDLNGAMADAEAAIKMEPQNPEAYDARAEVKKAKGDIEGCIADINYSTILIQQQTAELQTKLQEKTK